MFRSEEGAAGAAGAAVLLPCPLSRVSSLHCFTLRCFSSPPSSLQAAESAAVRAEQHFMKMWPPQGAM